MEKMFQCSHLNDRVHVNFVQLIPYLICDVPHISAHFSSDLPINHSPTRIHVGLHVHVLQSLNSYLEDFFFFPNNYIL